MSALLSQLQYDQKSDWVSTGAVAAAQSRLSHLQLFHSSVRTWMVYREIKKSLFNCNGIGALLFFIVAHEV